MTQTTVTLSEHSESLPLDLNQEERAHISSRFARTKEICVVRPLEGEGYIIESKSHVGIYSLGRYKIVVEPKVALTHVFQMLCLAFDLVAIGKEFAGYERIEELFEWLIRIFKKDVARLAADGLVSNYIEKKDVLSCVRGKIDIVGHLRTFRARHLIPCTFDEFHVDIIENQIILCVLEKLIGLDISRHDLKRQLKEIKKYFGEVSYRNFEADDIARIQYNALNAHYKPVHKFCRLVIELMGIHEKEGGGLFHAYSLDMNILFQEYVGRLLQKMLGSHNVVLQKRGLHLDIEGTLDIVPDIIIYDRNEPLLVLDTKYKLKDSVDDASKINAYMTRLDVDGVLLTSG